MLTAATTATERGQTRTQERDEMILRNLPLVRGIARRVRESVPVSVVFDDLVQAGVVGLIDAVDRYRPEMNVRFDLYAKFRVRGAILDSLRQLDTVSRDTRKRAKEIQRAADRCAQAVGRTPTESEVSDEMGINHRELTQAKRDLAAAGALVPSWHSVEVRQGEFLEPTEPESHNPYVRTSCADARKVLDLALLKLSPRYRRVIQMYYLEDKTMKDIGSDLGVNESRVSQIHKAALGKLQEDLRRQGMPSVHALMGDGA